MANKKSKYQESNDLVLRIQENYDRLRKSESIVADYLRDHAGERLNLSITDFAKILGTSEATISRVSRTLGYSGYSDMKLSLAEGAKSDSTKLLNMPVEFGKDDSLIGISAKIASLFSMSIQSTQQMLDAKKIEKIQDQIRSSRRVVLVGVGGSYGICEEAVHLFTKAGKDTVAFSDPYNQTIAAANLESDSMMIGISHTGTTQSVANALECAQSNGAKTLAITSSERSPLANVADSILLTWKSSTPSVPLYGDFLEGRISQLFLIDLLYLGLIYKDMATVAKHLNKTADALNKYFRRTD